MATIKSYTDISQSKKLAEILPLESADMFYPTNSDWEGKIIGLLDVSLYIGSDGFVDTEMGEIYAWSLAALFNVLPNSIYDNTDEYSQLEFSKISIAYHDMNDEIKVGSIKDNLVDACVEMIIKLHEKNLL